MTVPIVTLAAWVLEHFAPMASLNNACLITILLLWIAGGFVVRHQVANYYSHREGEPFRLSFLLTLVFSVWYIGGMLRADFPTGETNKAPNSVLKLAK